jgi:hypothetical protein
MNTDDLPKSVQAFFNSIKSAYEQTTLELLTEEVFMWLKENGMLKKFTVKQNI